MPSSGKGGGEGTEATVWPDPVGLGPLVWEYSDSSFADTSGGDVNLEC